MGTRIGNRVAGVVMAATLVFTGGLPVVAATTAQSSASGASSPSSSASSSTSSSSVSSSGSSSGSTATSTTASVPKLPPVPAALRNLQSDAGIVLPVNGFGSVSTSLSTAQIDQAVLPPSILAQRKYGTTLQQWERQGAKPVAAGTQVVIDAAQYAGAGQPSSGGQALVTATGVGGNSAKVLEWPESVPYVDYTVNVPATGLYQMNVNYYLYPSCYTANAATTWQQFVNTPSTINTTPWCGKGSSAERYIQIDPPGTVPASEMVQTEAPPVLPACIVDAAKKAALTPGQLPLFMNPYENQQALPDSPAWTVPIGTQIQTEAGPSCPNGQSSATSGASSSASSTTAASSSSTSASSSSSASSTGASSTSSTTASSTTASSGGSSSVGSGSSAATVPTNGPNACALDLNGTTGPVSYNGFEYAENQQVDFQGTYKYVGTKVAPNGQVLFQKDNQGDDLQPLTEAVPNVWQTTAVTDVNGTYGTPTLLCLTKGQHTLRLGMVSGAMAIQSITLQSPTVLPSYQQALAAWQAQGMKPVSSSVQPVFVQADNISQMSDGSIQPGSTANPGVKPQANGYYILNELDGQYWQTANEWVEWKITVPQTGLYKLGFKVLQPALQGLPATRTLTIDGKVPFDGAQWVSFPFADHWQVETLSQPNGQAALVGLTKGTHTIRMQVTMGLLGQVLSNIENLSQELGELQREIIMVTGASPSPSVNYHLTTNVPGLIPEMRQVIATLHQESNLLTYDAGGKPPVAANSLVQTADDLQRFVNDPSLIQLNISPTGEWTNDENALAGWVTQLQSQPLYMNWLAVAPPSYTWPPAGAGFIAQLGAFWKGFITSFFRNYTGVGNTYKNALNVWVGQGQTWADVLAQLTDSEFTPLTGIHVNFDTIPGGAGIVLLSEISGHAPDIATGMPATEPLNWALRGGAYNLQSFPDWSTVRKRFLQDALNPYIFTNAKGQSGVYGLPETQGMELMFYRSDILRALGISPPKSWQDLLNELPILQTEGMSIGYPRSSAGLFPFLYQLGGQYYQNTSNGIRSALGTTQAYDALKQWTSLFSDWNVPLEPNIFTQFQTGQLPISIGGYGEFVQLSVGAPSIAGLWNIAPIPGYVYNCDPGKTNCHLANPQVDCTQSQLNAGTCYYNFASNDGGASTVDMIPKSSQHPNEAWKFLYWWTSASVQLQYATDLEALGGIQVQWNTANIHALAGLPWPSKDVSVFQQAWSQFVPTPMVPGGYIQDRYIGDVWTNVVIDGENLRSQQQWAVQQINDELYRQEVQYGLAKLGNGQTEFNIAGA